MKQFRWMRNFGARCNGFISRIVAKVHWRLYQWVSHIRETYPTTKSTGNDRGDVPGWVLVVLMTTGLVTAIWMIAAPRLTAILRNSLDSMNGIR